MFGLDVNLFSVTVMRKYEQNVQIYIFTRNKAKTADLKWSVELYAWYISTLQ